MTITPIPDRAAGDAIARPAELAARRTRGAALMAELRIADALAGARGTASPRLVG